MKTLEFTVKINFSDDITAPAEIKEVANNVAEAIADMVDGTGIAPEDSEALTMRIEVTPKDLPDYTAEQKIY